MIQDKAHEQISKNQKKIRDWFLERRDNELSLPFYSSFDIRDSGHKIVPVDANLFPAGFNNICQTDKDSAEELVTAYLDRHYGNGCQKVVILTEEHTNNPYYWDNVQTLKVLIEGAGREVRVAIPKELPAPLKITSASGHEIEVHSATRKGSAIEVCGFEPCLVISNNDFSNEYQEWAEGLTTPINPPREMGWYRRKKSSFFEVYNELATEFCELIDLDPWCLTLTTEKHEKFNINDEASRNLLADHSEKVFSKILKEYKSRGIDQEPMVFIKNNSGTYGLGVIQAKSSEEIRTWNNKSRKKMKAAKGGGGFNEVIVQEGVSTRIQSDGASAEPAIYMIGCQLAGGFLRTHSKKGPDDSLNSPGAIYKRLCVSDLSINVEGHPMENVYGWVGKIGFLAIAQEAKNAGVAFRGYN